MSWSLSASPCSGYLGQAQGGSVLWNKTTKGENNVGTSLDSYSPQPPEQSPVITDPIPPSSHIFMKRSLVFREDR